MGRKCLKCGYERNTSDNVPDYECPQCGAIYSKVEAALRKNSVTESNISPSQEKVKSVNPKVVKKQKETQPPNKSSKNPKLIECKTCGKEVSKTAKTCPYCGEKNPAPSKNIGCLSTIVAVIVVLWAIGKFSGLDNRPSTSSTVSAPSIHPPSRPSAPPLEVLSFNCVKEHGYVFVRGEVKNISTKKLKNVMAVGEFRSASGNLIKTEDALIEYNPIMPGQASPYEAGGTDNPLITNCNLSFKHIFGQPISYKSKK